MQHATVTHEAWLLCWGFEEITNREGSAKVEATFSELIQSDGVLFVNAKGDGDGIEVTFVFDPSTGRSWARYGFVVLDIPPFNFENRTAEAVRSEQKKRSDR